MARLKLSKRISCVRSIVFAASWYAPFAANKINPFVAASGASFDSGKNNGGVAAHVRRKGLAIKNGIYSALP